MMYSTEHDPVELALQKMQFIFLSEIAQEWEGGFSDLWLFCSYPLIIADG